MTADHELFKVDDVVTRDGTDRQRIISINDARDLIDVECIRPSDFGWCKIGDSEFNVPWRYTYPDDATIEQTPPEQSGSVIALPDQTRKETR